MIQADVSKKVPGPVSSNGVAKVRWESQNVTVVIRKTRFHRLHRKYFLPISCRHQEIERVCN